IDTFSPGDGYEYEKWSVRLLLQRDKPGFTYGFIIRDQFLCVTPADPEKADSPRAKVSSTKPFSPSTIQIDGGRTKLQLPKVGHLEIEGPAALELVGENRVRVDRGRLKLKVTDESGHRVVVAIETPDGNLIGLDDGASLEVGPDGKVKLNGDSI